MGDTIRIDLYELDNLARELRRLSGDMDELGTQLRLAQYRLCGAAEEMAGDELARSRRKLFEMSEQSEAAAFSITRSVEQFAACEQNEKRQFEELMSTFPKFAGTFSRKDERKKQEKMSFAPKNVHFVRMSVSGGDERI